MNELGTMLGDMVSRLFGDLVTKDLLESAEKGQWPEKLWHALEENGLTLPLLPEEKGGAGGTWGDAYVLARAAGRHAVPLPLPETVVAGWLLSQAGLEVPRGPLTLAPVQRGDALTLHRANGGWRLSGRATRVPWGGKAEHLVIVALVEGRPMVALVATGAGEITRDTNLALEPRDAVLYDAAPVVAAAPGSDRVPVDAVWIYGAMVRAAQMAGGLEYLLQQSVQYAGERRQFGRAIGAFQAIQHQLAILAGHTAAAGMAAATAFHAADQGDPAFEVAVAKIRTGEAAGIAAGIAHQVHGAIGFTYEHALHFVTRRLWSWRAEFGGEGAWAAELGRDVAARGADALWPFLTSR